MLWDEPKIFFLERRYFFSIILSEFLKNRVALHEDISLVEIELAQKKKAIYLAHANCLRIVENGFKTYENDNGNISKIVIPLGRDIYKYYKT